VKAKPADPGPVIGVELNDDGDPRQHCRLYAMLLDRRRRFARR